MWVGRAARKLDHLILISCGVPAGGAGETGSGSLAPAAEAEARESGVVLAALDSPRSGCDDVGAVLVVALVVPDLPGGVEIDCLESRRDGVGALLVIPGPGLRAEQLRDAVGDSRAVGGLAGRIQGDVIGGPPAQWAGGGRSRYEWSSS